MGSHATFREVLDDAARRVRDADRSGGAYYPTLHSTEAEHIFFFDDRRPTTMSVDNLLSALGNRSSLCAPVDLTDLLGTLEALSAFGQVLRGVSRLFELVEDTAP